MSAEYEPTLLDVAKLLYATSGEGPSPDVVCLVEWLMDQVPEVRELWKTVNEPLAGSVTFRDLMDLQLCLDYELASDKAYGMAVWLLRRVPATARLWRRLEQMGEDAGQLLQYRSYGIDVVKYHAEVDRLLALDEWATPSACGRCALGCAPKPRSPASGRCSRTSSPCSCTC